MAVFEGYSQLLLEGTHIIKERGVGNGRFKRLFGIEHHIASKTSTWISCCPLRRGPCFFFLLWGSRASWKMVTSVRRGKNSCIILWKKRTPYKLWEKLPTLVLVKKKLKHQQVLNTRSLRLRGWTGSRWSCSTRFVRQHMPRAFFGPTTPCGESISRGVVSPRDIGIYLKSWQMGVPVVFFGVVKYVSKHIYVDVRPWFFPCETPRIFGVNISSSFTGPTKPWTVVHTRKIHIEPENHQTLE